MALKNTPSVPEVTGSLNEVIWCRGSQANPSALDSDAGRIGIGKRYVRPDHFLETEAWKLWWALDDDDLFHLMAS
nr:hypothetical protein CKG001_10410 [Bdellovibrio sp. CKG001]